MKLYCYLILLLAHFWTRWSREYVVELHERHQVKGHTSSAPVIRERNIVTVMEEGKTNRGTWKLGRVVKLLPGTDREVRMLSNSETWWTEVRERCVF